MSNVLVDESYLSDIATAIRGKNGLATTYKPSEMAAAIDDISTSVTLQSKTATPTTSSQTITADSDYDGLSSVTVNSIPSEYIVPSGSVSITSNGTVDVTDYASAIVNVGGYLPPSATLVASVDETINLSTGTSYDSWTPTTTATSVLAVGTTRGACSYTITSDYQDTALIGACLYHNHMEYTGSVAKGYLRDKIVYGVAYYVPMKLPNYSNNYYGVINIGANGRITYNSSASATAIFASTNYGVSPTTATWSVSSATSTSSRVVGFTRPIVYARCHATYFTTTAAAAVDSASSNLYCYYRIWAMPKEDCIFYKLFDATNGIFFTA